MRAFSSAAKLLLALALTSCGRPSARPLPPPPPLAARAPSPRPAPGASSRDVPPPRTRARPRPAPQPSRYTDELQRMVERFHGRPAKSRSNGVASYYSDALAGRSTASGEPYEPRAYTAAHRSLPFGTIVRVVREDTGELTYAKINDRGPFVRGRIIDLSRAAAEDIDLIRRGIVRVRVEVLERGTERPRSKSRSSRGKRRK